MLITKTRQAQKLNFTGDINIDDLRSSSTDRNDFFQGIDETLKNAHVKKAIDETFGDKTVEFLTGDYYTGCIKQKEEYLRNSDNTLKKLVQYTSLGQSYEAGKAFILNIIQEGKKMNALEKISNEMSKLSRLLS